MNTNSGSARPEGGVTDPGICHSDKGPTEPFLTRAFRMPAEVDFNNATLKDGVLEIRVPNGEQAKQKEKKYAWIIVSQRQGCIPYVPAPA